MFNQYYRDKRVLITGHTGFKGGWLSLWTKHLGAHVYGLGLSAPTAPSFYELLKKKCFRKEYRCDVRNFSLVKKAVAHCKPDIIFHLAAQPLVLRSYIDPVNTFDINVMGTIYVLEAVRQLQIPCRIVIITSDKCYQNNDDNALYREDHPLGGKDVYSASKAATEIALDSWRFSYFEKNNKLGPLISARAGNVIGGGDYAQNRLVPDCIRALIKNDPIVIRRPQATRPWQHVLDCLSGYLWLGSLLTKNNRRILEAGSFNFGPEKNSRLSVELLVKKILADWPGKLQKGKYQAPYREAKFLGLSIQRAQKMLGWSPTWNLSTGIKATVSWYRERHVYKRKDMMEYSLAQIEAFTRDAQRKKLAWAAFS